jgi:di/tricarboxylate transporter
MHELLLVASKLAFALNAWVTLILILELIFLLLLVEKENATKDISTHCFRFA